MGAGEVECPALINLTRSASVLHELRLADHRTTVLQFRPSPCYLPPNRPNLSLSFPRLPPLPNHPTSSPAHLAGQNAARQTVLLFRCVGHSSSDPLSDRVGLHEVRSVLFCLFFFANEHHAFHGGQACPAGIQAPSLAAAARREVFGRGINPGFRNSPCCRYPCCLTPPPPLPRQPVSPSGKALGW